MNFAFNYSDIRDYNGTVDAAAYLSMIIYEQNMFFYYSFDEKRLHNSQLMRSFRTTWTSCAWSTGKIDGREAVTSLERKICTL